jgi:hypothetical protein
MAHGDKACKYLNTSTYALNRKWLPKGKTAYGHGSFYVRNLRRSHNQQTNGTEKNELERTVGSVHTDYEMDYLSYWNWNILRYSSGTLLQSYTEGRLQYAYMVTVLGTGQWQ